MLKPSHKSSDLGARIFAGLIFLSMIGILAIIHWEDLTGGVDNGAVAANPALAACLDKRLADVERMAAEGVVNDTQAQAFSERARAFCIGKHGTRSGPPSPGNL